MSLAIARVVLAAALARDHVDRAVGGRGHVQVPVGSGHDVGDDPEILAGDQALALALVELVIVVVDPIPQCWVAEGEVLPAVVELELEQVALVEEGPGGADEQVVGVLRPEPIAREADGRRRHGPPPTELGVRVVRAGQDDQLIPGLARAVGDPLRRISHLLQRWDEGVRVDRAERQVAALGQVPLHGSEGRFDLLELVDSAGRPHVLDPAAIGPGGDVVHLVECVIAVLRLPQEAGLRVEGEAEAVAVAVRVDLLDVGADVTARFGAELEERVVGRGGAVRVEPEDHPGVVGVVGLRPTELVVGLPHAERAVGQVLVLPAAALVADLEVELAVRAEEDLAGVVVAPLRLVSVCLERP